MGMTYIIVVDVDNVRAAKAFRKGYEDILRLWPQIEAKNAVKAKASRAMVAEHQKAIDRAQAEHDAAHEEYRLALKAHEEWTGSFLSKGSRPELPAYPSQSWWLNHLRMHRPSNNHDWFLEKYESIKADVKHMMNVAEAATGPYRMTEHQIARMVAWEDDSKIDAIRKDVEHAL
jgi:hypothetical protein